MKKKTSSPKTAESGKLKKALSCWQLYILLIPALIWLIVFAYYPMYGLIIAFKDFKGRMGIMGSPWADPIFKYFKMFFSTSIAMTAIKNTIIISLESLIIGFPIPVIFALLLNQVQRSGPRRIIQTISYAPYFMSNVVVVSLISVLFSANGEDLIVYPQAMEGTSYTIPDTVREIWTSAFSNTKLTDVTFPDGLLYIDDWAFASAALTSLDLPDTVTGTVFPDIISFSRIVPRAASGIAETFHVESFPCKKGKLTFLSFRHYNGISACISFPF